MGNGNSMDKVIEGLYIGGVEGANSKEMLKERNITHILSVHHITNIKNRELQYHDDFQYKWVMIKDIRSSDMTPHFTECVDFIHKARMEGGGVYIHCLDFRDSLRVMKHCRKQAKPNSGFRQQLIKYGEEKVSEEKKRINDKFPNTEKLDDENTLRNLLQEAPSCTCC